MRDLRIGIGIVDRGGDDLDELVASIRSAEAAGFHSAWIPNVFGTDALTLAALAGRETTRLEIGTAVVPTYSRHPYYMAQQALSTQAAAGGRFVLGLGPSHKVVIEGMFGLSYEKPARHVREYVEVVKQLIDRGKVGFAGETYRVNASLTVKTPPCPVLIGALGPLMRGIAGTLADGTITWMTGRRTLGETIGPEIRAAAEQAGRAEPRIVAGFPVALTDDPRGAREAASKAFAMYGSLPSYRKMLEAEGVADPSEVAILGSESDIEDALGALASAGVTDVNCVIFPYGEDRPACAQRTRELLASLSRG